jgi:hypothetical protein
VNLPPNWADLRVASQFKTQRDIEVPDLKETSGGIGHIEEAKMAQFTNTEINNPK